VRVPARKARQVLDGIRGKPVAEALATLRFTPRAAARLIEKVLRSAVANAEHNHQVRDLDALRVIQATADDGPSMKRVSPRAMGRAFFIRHRTSHLTIGVTDETNGSAAPARPAAPGAAPGRAAGTAAQAATPRAKLPRPETPKARAPRAEAPRAKEPPVRRTAPARGKRTKDKD
jgi:large subunit ribosomal protein L22